MNFKVFLINMDKSAERLEFMSGQLERQNLAFEREAGVDGKHYDFSNAYDESLSQRLNGAPLADVEKGCALSHRNALEKIIEEDLEYALIMEDDVELPSFFRKVLDLELERRKRKETSWEYLAFNYPTVGYKFVRLWLFLVGEQFRKHPTFWLYLRIPVLILKFFGISFVSFFERIRELMYRKLFTYGKPALFFRPMYLAGCYLVTQEGAKKLLKVQNKLIYPADRIQNIARMKYGLKLYWFVPLLVKQRRDKFKSTMFDYSKSVKKYVYSDYD